MNKIRISLIVAATSFLLMGGSLRAQTSIQHITLSLLGEYQTNTFFTNTTAFPDGPWTSQYSFIRPVLITTFNVMRSLALDLEGTNYKIWNGSELLREVNLVDGTEGIFLRKGTNQTNVSRFFEGSYVDNFQSQVTNAFPALTNNIAGLTNDLFEGNTNIPQTLLFHGWQRRPDPLVSNDTTTNFVSTAGIYFVSFNTTNIKFNLLGVGDGGSTNLVGPVEGTAKTNIINSEFLGTAGTFFLNSSSNIYDLGTNPPNNVTGPMHGSFIVGPPVFSTIPGP